ncbi:MAG: TetR/AcrR family transcriptional regulator [Ruminococcaceae bacterium]|nr:TetR/AcrR family transcriptional regulator [Oscillospiraceae bacterium]
MPIVITDLREKILAAARSALLSGGYEELNMRRIAASCGIAVGTVYNYFPSKEMLAAGVMLMDWQETLGHMRRDIQTAPAPLDALRAIFDWIVGFSDRYRLSWEQYADAGKGYPLRGGYHRQLVGQLEEMIVSVLERFGCVFVPALPGFLAEGILSAAAEGHRSFDQLAPIFSRLL